MRKIFIGLSFLSIFICGGCKKEEFGYKLTQPAIGDIDSIYFSATDKMMIADGQARLDFIVETYRKIHQADGVDSMEFIDYQKLPAGSLKIIEERSGSEVGMSYSTTTIPFDTVRFHAELGNLRSASRSVALRPVPALPPKLYVDVVFHVWELNSTSVSYDPSSYQAVQYQQLLDAISYMNDVINNKVSHSPNGASANIEFRLATKNQLGQTMPQPGFDKQVYSDNLKVNPAATTFSVTDFSTYINNNKATLIWDPKQFLNIHVLPSGSNNAMGNVYPAKQLPPGPGEQAILGVAGTATDDNDFISDYANAVCGFPRTLLFPGYERKIEAFRFIGMFYGLYTPLYSAARLYSDYCYDTRKFDGANPVNSYSFATKVELSGQKYIADNAMDDSRYPTLLNSITEDQVTRMRAVMARCPGKMNAKTQ